MINSTINQDRLVPVSRHQFSLEPFGNYLKFKTEIKSQTPCPSKISHHLSN